MEEEVLVDDIIVFALVVDGLPHPNLADFFRFPSLDDWRLLEVGELVGIVSSDGYPSRGEFILLVI
jgi:hypothetical protein